MSAHTPGPWRVHPREMLTVYGAHPHDDGADDVIVARCSTAFLSLATCAANARLIAAAPTLVDALISAERVIAQTLDAPYRDEVLAEIRAALRLAEGGAVRP